MLFRLGYGGVGRKRTTRMTIKSAAPLLVSAVMAVATAPFAAADPAYVGIAVGFQPTGAPQGLPYVSTTAAGAQQGALQACRSRLVACAPAGTSTQCIGVAGVGKQWQMAEGPDKSTAQSNARAALLELVADLPLPDVTSDDLVATTAACPWD